jgi:hypothetical protein
MDRRRSRVATDPTERLGLKIGPWQAVVDKPHNREGNSSVPQHSHLNNETKLSQTTYLYKYFILLVLFYNFCLICEGKI